MNLEVGKVHKKVRLENLIPKLTYCGQDEMTGLSAMAYYHDHNEIQSETSILPPGGVQGGDGRALLLRDDSEGGAQIHRDR